jgi:predicted dehydrogenase
MTQRRVGVGVIGQGFIARAHSYALAQLRLLTPAVLLEPVVLCGADLTRAEANACAWGFQRATRDWRDVVAARDVDLVCVFTPNDLHHPIVLAALEAGKAVLCEKPLGRTLAQSRELAVAAARTPVLQACSFNYRFMPAVQLARQLVGEGALGEIAHFRARYLQDWGWDAPHDWHHDEARAGTGAFGDYCHVIDLAHHLLGDVARVSAEALTVRTERQDRTGVTRPVSVEDAYAATGRLATGALLALECSRVATGRKAQQLFEINGELGSVWWDMEDLNHLWFHRAADGATAGFRRILVTEAQHPFLSSWWPAGHTLGWEHALVHQWLGLAVALADRDTAPPDPQATFEDGWRADIVVDALARAAASGQVTHIDYRSDNDQTERHA